MSMVLLYRNTIKSDPFFSIFASKAVTVNKKLIERTHNLVPSRKNNWLGRRFHKRVPRIWYHSSFHLRSNWDRFRMRIFSSFLLPGICRNDVREILEWRLILALWDRINYFRRNRYVSIRVIQVFLSQSKHSFFVFHDTPGYDTYHYSNEG